VCRPGAGGATDFALSEILAPLERHKRDLVVVQNLQQNGGYGHQYTTTLTGYESLDRGYPRLYARGISVDQLLAQRLAGKTPLPSLELGVGVVDGRDTISSVSWTAAGIPAPPENDPFKLFARLFSSGTPRAQAELQRLSTGRRSVMDGLLAQLGTLRRQVGSADRAVLAEYLQSVRAIEQQMAALAARRCAPPPIGAEPPAVRDKPWWLVTESFPEVTRLQIALAVAALACDLTRVVTITVANAGGYFRMLPWIPELPKGVDWHGISHMVEKGQDAPLAAIERWHYGELAGLIDALAAAREADGRSLLFHTLVLANNEYGANGPVRFVSATKNFTHQTRFMPYLLLGQAGGALATGRNLVYPVDDDGKGLRQNRLLVSILNALGHPDTSFGDPTVAQGPLPDLLA
jgi:hypothetical protein